MFSPEILRLARDVVTGLSNRRLTIVTAESCTGGLISGALTAISGSSEVLYGGFVTYANEAKTNMIGVPEDTLARWGAVSYQTAEAMAEGGRKAAETDVSVAVTGIAGPTGGSTEKPVGLVYVAAATNKGTWYHEERFGDIGRDAIREKTVIAALKLVLDVIRADQP